MGRLPVFCGVRFAERFAQSRYIPDIGAIAVSEVAGDTERVKWSRRVVRDAAHSLLATWQANNGQAK